MAYSLLEDVATAILYPCAFPYASSSFAPLFKGRPSSVNYNVYTDEEKADGTYTGVASGTYNYGPSNEALKERVETAVTEFKAEYKKATGEELTEEIPTDLLTASGSGLDPHISPASARSRFPLWQPIQALRRRSFTRW